MYMIQNIPTHIVGKTKHSNQPSSSCCIFKVDAIHKAPLHKVPWDSGTNFGRRVVPLVCKAKTISCVGGNKKHVEKLKKHLSTHLTTNRFENMGFQPIMGGGFETQSPRDSAPSSTEQRGLSGARCPAAWDVQLSWSTASLRVTQ